MREFISFFLSVAFGLALLILGAAITPPENPARVLLTGGVIGALWAFGTFWIWKVR
jgi:hypothetical protein